MKSQNRRIVAAVLAAFALVLLSGASALAQGVETDDPSLPPKDGVYLSPDDVHANYTGTDLDLVLEQPQHKPIADQAQREDVGPDELETFDSVVDAFVSGETPFGPLPLTPVQLTGPVQVLTLGKVGNVTGTFQTEMISMSLTGNMGGIPVEIRESPTQPSQGVTTITDLGGGQFRIDSFFDVFTELSVNGGPFMPDLNGPSRMELHPAVPEPAGLGLIGVTLLALRKRRN